MCQTQAVNSAIAVQTSPLWRSCTVFALALLSIASAASFNLTVTLRGDTLLLQADSILRYTVDYARRTVLIPDAKLSESSVNFSLDAFGARLNQREDGVLLEMNSDFTATLSADGRLLTVNKGTPSSTSSLGANDGRVPVVFYLSYADPAAVAALLQRLYPGLVVEVDPRQRALIMRLSAEDRPVIEQAVRLLDAPRPQVMFEAEVLEINRSITQALGIDYSKLLNLNFRFAEGTLAPGQVGPGTFARQPVSLEVGIRLLKSNGAAKTLARPRVVTLDGVEARLNATQTRPVRVVSSGNTSLLNITTGITMRFLPRVTPDLSVESQLSIAVSSPTEVVDNVPGYSTREANTTVRVRNGEPIVIGGLLETRTAESRSGIPGLMDIPYLGYLFGTTDTSETSTDLVIVVTPTIITSPTASPSTTPANSQP
jgi:general secretion pathway protein D